jgi:hypothetical protein
MRTHKKCEWCHEEIQQEDLKISYEIGHYVHKKCWDKLGEIIREALK